jgi:fructose-1,6-bisphosphatase/inositol monophosphatase family enzyme
MLQWNCDAMTGLMAEAGRRALVMAGGAWEFKADQTLVTAADRAVEALLAAAFDRPEEGSYLIGEETVATRGEEYLARAWQETAWIVDPIDGTAPYAHGLSTWGVSVAMAKAGELREGALFVPSTGDLYLTASGKARHARAAGSPESWDFQFHDLARHPLPVDAGGMVSITQNMAKLGRLNLPNPVQALCSCVYSTAGLLNGSYLAYVGNLALWDLAGSLPLLRAQGFRGRFLDGRPFPMDRISWENCHLGADDPRRWRFCGETVFAATDEALDYVLAGIEDPG